LSQVADLERVASRLIRILGEKDCLLVGAMAVAAHGYVRATDDIDLVTRLALDDVRRRLRDQGIPAALRRGDTVLGEFSGVRGTLDGIEFDVLPQIVPLDWERAIDLSFSDFVFKVVDLDGLIRLKLRAQGAQDLLDVAMLLHQHPEHIERARSLVKAYGVLEELDMWLHDPRLKTKADESPNSKSRRKRPPAACRRGSTRTDRKK
jgi:hypothetical protein